MKQLIKLSVIALLAYQLTACDVFKNAADVAKLNKALDEIKALKAENHMLKDQLDAKKDNLNSMFN